ncbi:MAG TPA: phage terminase large subunit [Gemmata sp.]
MVAPASPPERIEVRPQRGPQELFARCSADVAVYGGAAGGGKSWALLLEPLYHVANPAFGCTIFRRTYPMVTAQGGLWQESAKLYGALGAAPTANDLRWKFPSGAEVKFAHLQHEATVLGYQGAQIPLIGFDELTHFTEYQFNYMLSRNRSTCGVRPYMRATTNPDAASWVARWIEWWIDPSTGLPIPERGGRVRWFVRDGETLRWADSPEQLRKEYPQAGDPLSFTFVPASLDDNKVLLAADPRYRAALMALPRVERERLLRGNWLVSAAVGRWPAEYFGRHLWFNDWPLEEDRTICVIAWDPNQGTDSKYGDFSAFTVLIRDGQGRLYADAHGSQSWPVEEAIDQGLELCRIWAPDGFAIEGNAFQKLLKPMVLKRARELGVPPPVKLIDNRVKKELRIQRLGPHLENKSIRLKGGSTGARQLAEQLMTFPNGDHDDFPDSLEMALRTMIALWNDGMGKQPRRK